MENAVIGWEVIISVLTTLILALQTAIWRRLDKMEKQIEKKLDRTECEKQISACERVWCDRVMKDLDALHQKLREMREESNISRAEFKEYIKDMHEGLVENMEHLWQAHRSHSHTSLEKDSQITLSRLMG